MDIYSESFAKKYYPALTLKDISNKIEDKIVYPDPRCLCKNHFWLKLYYPEVFNNFDYKGLIFEYDSSINKLFHVTEMIDIICQKEILSYGIMDDLSIATLLCKYASKFVLYDYLERMLISKSIHDRLTLNPEITVSLIKTFVDSKRWHEIPDELYKKKDSTPQYEFYSIIDVSNNNEDVIMLSTDVIMPLIYREGFSKYARKTQYKEYQNGFRVFNTIECLQNLIFELARVFRKDETRVVTDILTNEGIEIVDIN